MTRLRGYALIWLCAAVDRVPWFDGRWYLYGRRGCAWGLAARGFRLLERQ